MAENLWIDEVMWAAGREHLKKIGQIPADEPGEAEGTEAPAGSDEAQPEGPSEPTQWMELMRPACHAVPLLQVAAHLSTR